MTDFSTKTIFILSIILLAFTNCNQSEKTHDEHNKEAHHEENLQQVHLSALQYNSLDMKTDTMPMHTLSGLIKVNGKLRVPPQHEASITAVLGGNISSIKVIEGSNVSKGQVLGHLSHPDLINIQTNYLETLNRLAYLKKEYERQQQLLKEDVGSGKTFQKTESDYLSAKAKLKGYKAKLKQLHINPESISNEHIYEKIPIKSPVKGSVEQVRVRLGQYVEPSSELFLIVNTDHIHADLMVFEKDVNKVRVGQKVYFTIQSVPEEPLTATIFAVGKKFKDNPKAVHLHASIDNKKGYLIPGMYINGHIITEEKKAPALPEEAIIEENGRSYIFRAQKEEEHNEWAFTPIEIKKGMSYEGWVAIHLLDSLPKGSQIALNNAYYLISEMKKGQTEHSH